MPVNETELNDEMIALDVTIESETNPLTDSRDQYYHDETLTLKLMQWFREDISHVMAWRKEAREDYAFYNGDQWAPEDLEILHQQKRPIMTFNRVAPLVNAVVGSEINNRRQVRYIPRELGDSVANELLTGAGEWFRDQSGAEDEDSEAFSDTVICGMGWTDTRLDFSNNPDGDPVVQRLDPLKMVWDCAAAKANLIDAERVWYVDEKPIDELQAMFPDADVHDLHAAWVNNSDQVFSANCEEECSEPFSNVSDREASGKRNMATLVECRWYERELVFRGPDLITGEPKLYSKKEVDHILKRFPDFPHVKHYRKIVKRAFIGRTVLAPPDRPLVPQGQLGWECITGYFDKLARQFYGVVRPTKDPQRWSNKFFSQVMYLLNSQAKGGLLAERGAFDDDRQAEESLARADQITWTKNGALSASTARIQPKPVAQFPAGFFTLFNESKEAISQVTGLSPEFIGTREVNQPGILESQRRQSSLNLLASLFNSLRRYRKRQGNIVLYLIQNYLSDGRLIRIVGEDKQRYVPLTREIAANRQYDIIVDDAPTSPNEKERTFAVIQQMLPILKDYLTPEIGLEILKYSPLPASLVDRWRHIALTQKTDVNDDAPTAKDQLEQMKLQGLGQDLQAKQLAHTLDIKNKSVDLYIKQMQAENELRLAAIRTEAAQQKQAAENIRNSIDRQNADTKRSKITTKNSFL